MKVPQNSVQISSEQAVYNALEKSLLTAVSSIKLCLFPSHVSKLGGKNRHTSLGTALPTITFWGQKGLGLPVGAFVERKAAFHEYTDKIISEADEKND